jgi:hypothetical protein
MSMKNSNDTIGNRSRDLPVCSAVPQPTAPPRAPISEVLHENCVRLQCRATPTGGDEISHEISDGSGVDPCHAHNCNFKCSHVNTLTITLIPDLIRRVTHINHISIDRRCLVYDLSIACYETEHFLLAATERERLSVSHRGTRKYDFRYQEANRCGSHREVDG